MSEHQTNKEMAAKDEHFKECCSEAGIPPTGRQAGKFRRKCGKAWKDGLSIVKDKRRKEADEREAAKRAEKKRLHEEQEKRDREALDAQQAATEVPQEPQAPDES